MSAICCAVPSLNLMATGGGVAGSSSLPVVYPHHHFSRPSAPLHHPNSFSFMELNNSSSHQYQQLPCHQPVDQFTATVYGSSQQQQQHHHQQFLMPQQQAVASCSQRASRRKKLEDALTEAIPAASSGKVSQRIAQLQQSLYASCHPGRMIQQQQQQQYPSVSSSSSRPLSLDPLKDYSQPLTVDCSIEYDLPRVTRPPPGAKPLLLIARRPPPPPTLPAVVNQSPPTRQRQQQQQQQQQWNPAVRTAHHHHQVLLQQQQQQSSQQQFQFRPDCGYFVMNIAPVSSSSSEDSGRGTDSEQHPSASSPITSYRTAVHPANNNNWTSIAEPQWSLIRQQQQLKFNQQHVKPTALPQHPRPAEAARARVSMTTEQSSGCHCCPSRSNQFPVQRWAPYTTQTSMMAARHGCPAPSSVVFQQQQQQESWTRWNDSSVSLDQLILQQTPHYNNNHPSSSSSLMAFHI